MIQVKKLKFRWIEAWEVRKPDPGAIFGTSTYIYKMRDKFGLAATISSHRMMTMGDPKYDTLAAAVTAAEAYIDRSTEWQKTHVECI